MKSRALLARRFPALLAWIEGAPPPGQVEWLAGAHPALVVDGVQLASRHDPLAEAELQSRLVPPGTRAAALYGFGQGELPRVLLARAELESLRVFVLNPGQARACLERCDQSDWLADERVELARASELVDLVAPFAASPACLRLASDEAARLRDLVVLELATPHIRRHQRALAAELRERSAEIETRFAGDGDVGELFGTLPGAIVVVAAAGPTLARHFDELRRRTAPLIAVDAALKPLLAAGLVPEIVVTLDTHEEGMRRIFDVPLESLRRSVLVYFPCGVADVLGRWPGRRLAAGHEGVPAAAGGTLRRASTLFTSGSVLHPAVDLGVKLGAARVELMGADFCLPGGRSHVEGAAWQFSFELRDSGPWVLDGHGQRVPSLPNLIGYLRDLERYIAARPAVQFVNRSQDGALIRGAQCAGTLHVA